MSRPPGSRGSSGERSAGLGEGHPGEQTLLTPCLWCWGCGGRGPATWAPGIRDGPVLGRLLGEGAAEQGRRASVPSGDTASAAGGRPGIDQGKRGTTESRRTGPSCAPLSEVILGLDCLV